MRGIGMDDKQFALNLMWGILIVGIIMVTFFGTKQHEDAHKAIAEQHGCIYSETSYYVKNFAFTGHYVCKEYGIRSREMELQEKNLHAYNEIVSYNNDKIVNTLFLIGILIVMATNIYVIKADKKVKCSEN